MNFLAHLYLSQNNKSIIIGNFIADAVKGKQYNNYPSEIKKGILLHRHIDTFTDQHPIVRQSMHRLNKIYGHYNGVIIDIFYDHFLAKNWNNYSNIPLPLYASEIYTLLQSRFDIFPEKIQYMLPYMIEYNWLISYASLEGIERILTGMNKRTQGKSKMHLAIADLKLHYNDLENDFTLFFEDVIEFSKTKTLALLKN